MTDDTSTALNTVLTYHRAWTGSDFEQAMTLVAEDIVCDAPPGRIEGREAFRAFMGPFAQMLKAAKMIAAFGDGDTVMLMYDTETALVRSAPGAECVTVRDGKIVHIRIVFDRLPFQQARQAVPD